VTVPSGSSATLGRVRSSAALGEFHEYGEKWWRSLLVIAVWAGFFLLCIPWSQNTNFASCSRGYCGPQVVETERNTVVYMALVSFLAAAIFTWRRFFRHPGLRIGEFGFENRTNVFRVQRVRWQDVRILYPSKMVFWWRAMNVGLMRRPDQTSYPSTVTILLTGLSASPREIEAELATAAREHRGRQRAKARAGAQDSQILVGTSLITGPDESEPINDISSATLFNVLSSMPAGRSFVVMTSPALGDNHFVQASRAQDASWRVEYRDGGPDRHYSAQCDDVEALHEVFVDWAEGLSAWRTSLPWQRLDLRGYAGPGAADS
jgi:hypothetical protein